VPNKSTQVEEPTEVLEPTVEHRTVSFGEEPYDFTFVQKPLSFFGKMEIFSVLGNALDKAMSGPDGLSLSELLDGPRPTGDALTVENFRDADAFVKAITKLVLYAPELFLDLYAVILSVPRGQRVIVKEVMEQELSDEEGIKILETFIDQNWDVMVDFFTVQIRPLIQKVSSKTSPESQPSKPSKPTPQVTPKP
jgi:hypothetical protein